VQCSTGTNLGCSSFDGSVENALAYFIFLIRTEKQRFYTIQSVQYKKYHGTVCVGITSELTEKPYLGLGGPTTQTPSISKKIINVFDLGCTVYTRRALADKNQ
jgi:hypothetical protein